MSSLHISKVAVGCASFEALRKRQLGRARGGVVPMVTRFRPKRAPELVGGSVFWIVKHRIVARQEIQSFGETEEGRCLVLLDAALVPVRAYPKRAHQGWRYLAAADAPADLGWGEEEDGIDALPPALAVELASLALL